MVPTAFDTRPSAAAMRPSAAAGGRAIAARLASSAARWRASRGALCACARLCWFGARARAERRGGRAASAARPPPDAPPFRASALILEQQPGQHHGIDCLHRRGARINVFPRASLVARAAAQTPKCLRAVVIVAPELLSRYLPLFSSTMASLSSTGLPSAARNMTFVASDGPGPSRR